MSKRNIYFGSLEDQIPEKREEIEEGQGERGKEGNDYEFGNINSKSGAGNIEITNSPRNDEFDRRALSRTLKIPTLDSSVRTLLISLNQPMTLFGEGPAERRERLRMMAGRAILSLRGAFELFPVLRGLVGEESGHFGTVTGTATGTDGAVNDDSDEEFYVPGSVDLIKTRSFILEDSINRCRQRAKQIQIDHVAEHNKRTELYEQMKSMDLKATYMDPNGRPLSTCTFTFNGDLITGDWSGRVNKYNDDSSGSSVNLVKSGDRITAMASHQEEIVIGSSTGRIEFISTRNIPAAVNIPTPHAIKSLNFHPSAILLASVSSDSLWRLWDTATMQEIQVQEGHVDGVSAGTWHPDGAIYSTGGDVDGMIRIWDCRLGKAVWTIQTPPESLESTATITNLAFSPQSPHILASTTKTGILSLHDLRRLAPSYLKIAAHRSCCSGLKFISGGRSLVTSGFDGCVRLWCPGDLRLVGETGTGSNSKITAMDTFENGNGPVSIATVAFDKSVKIFQINK